MEIERINEHTVKFFLSYVDIEERGFDRDEIWYNRDKSEELFWEMMDEVHDEEDFMAEGPLWIQVQALDMGLEVIVTKAQLSKDGQKLELPIPEDKLKAIDQNLDSIMDHFDKSDLDDDDIDDEVQRLQFMIRFDDLENIISLSSHHLYGFHSHLFSFENRYYMYIDFEDEQDDDEIENTLSIILEYGQESRITIHRLEEYGKEIFSENVLNQIRKYFV
jgi:adapter protein MecA 1/2